MDIVIIKLEKKNAHIALSKDTKIWVAMWLPHAGKCSLFLWYH